MSRNVDMGIVTRKTTLKFKSQISSYMEDRQFEIRCSWNKAQFL